MWKRLGTMWQLGALLLASLPLNAWSDNVLLKDGRQIDGKITRQDDLIIITPAEGSPVTVKQAEIQKVTLSSVLTPADQAENEWAIIQTKIRGMNDLSEISAVIQTFLRKHGETPTAKIAQAALEEYQKMIQFDYVKFRGRWMPRAQAEVTLRRALDKAKPAWESYQAGKLQDAAAQAQAALKIDEANSLALSILGLVSYRQNQLQQARDYFTKLTEVEPQGLLGWNNLAIVSYQQNRQPEALLHYTKALQAGAGNRLLIDNIAQALHTYTGAKDGQPYINLQRQYTQAHAKMAITMADKGLYRFGNTWVNAQQSQRLAEITAAVKNQMSELEGQFQQTSAKIASLEIEIKRTAEIADGILSDYNYFNNVILASQSRGIAVDYYWFERRDAAAADYDRAVRRKAALEDQRLALLASLKELRGEAGKVKDAIGKAQDLEFNGIQRIMEPGDETKPPAPAPVNVPAKMAEAPIPVNTPAPPAQPPAPQTQPQNLAPPNNSGGLYPPVRK